MKGFEPVTLGWAGEEYRVPAERQMMLVATIEDTLLGDQGGSAALMLLQGGVKMNRLARAYAAALRYAGATVTDDEVYLAMQTDLAESGADREIELRGAVLALLDIVSPPMALKVRQATAVPEEDEAPGKD